MAKTKVPDELQKKLDEYKAGVLTEVRKLDKLHAEYVHLMQKRLGLARTKKLAPEKRAEWNKMAAEWRAAKDRILDEAVAGHTPHYQRIKPVAKDLTGAVQYKFSQQLQTLNRFFVKADATIRARTLEDL